MIPSDNAVIPGGLCFGFSNMGKKNRAIRPFLAFDFGYFGRLVRRCIWREFELHSLV